MLEMWDAWSNRREPPSAIPWFPELIPRLGGAINVPMSNPFIPCGYLPILSNGHGMPSIVRPQALVSRALPVLFFATPIFIAVQLAVPKP